MNNVNEFISKWVKEGVIYDDYPADFLRELKELVTNGSVAQRQRQRS